MNETKLYARIALPELSSPDRIYTYYIPERLNGMINVGSLVSVEFGKKVLSGFVYEITNTFTDDYPLKPVIDNLDRYTDKPLLSSGTVSFLHKLASYYITDPASYLPYCIPQSLITNFIRYIKLSENWEDKLPAIMSKSGRGLVMLLQKESLLYDNLTPAQKKTARELIGIGLIDDDFRLTLPQDKYNYDKIVHINPEADMAGLTKRQKEITGKLSEYPDGLRISDLVDAAGTTQTTIHKLIDSHILTVSHAKRYRDTFNSYLINVERYTEAVPDIQIPEKEYLVTGGSIAEKMAAHIQIIGKIIENGELLYLVPDRTLIGYVLSSVAAVYSLDKIAILHGDQNENEHYEQWLRVHNGEARIIIATKQGIFAPFTNLRGVIVMDEHDGGYGENYYPAYGAVKAVQLRAEIDTNSDIKVFYTSDTPSIETRHRCSDNIIRLTPQKYTITVVDMRQEIKDKNPTPVSRLLRGELERHSQAVLLWLRRGYANVVVCRMCGYVDKCGYCHIPLSYHKTRDSHIMKCHKCQAKKPVLTECPDCHSNKIRFLSGGTQKVEEFLRQLFPDKKISRVDGDTITRKGQLATTQKEFLSGGIDMVIGTQLVSRGFYSNKDTCVGLILADVILHIPSYNASHRFYGIVMQLAAESPEHSLILQTYTPDIPVMQYIADNDYESFYANELKNRESYAYPPFSKLYKIEVFHKDEEKLNQLSQLVYNDLKLNLGDKALVGKPDIPYIPRQGDRFIREISIKAYQDTHQLITEYYRNKSKELKTADRDAYINIIVDSDG